MSGYLRFLHSNRRWLLGGFALFLMSSFGQTFFVSLSAGDIRAEYGLSHGEFGSLFMFATLASALALTQIGSVVDRFGAAGVVLGSSRSWPQARRRWRCRHTSPPSSWRCSSCACSARG
ncbi:hypothetical protein HFP72_04095 [Nocardiopsis sp. ARC36]